MSEPLSAGDFDVKGIPRGAVLVIKRTQKVFPGHLFIYLLTYFYKWLLEKASFLLLSCWRRQINNRKIYR